MFICLPYIHMPPEVPTPPICPPYSSLPLYVLRGFCMLSGVVGGPLHVGHLPYMLDTFPVWGASPYVLHPLTHWLASLCICMFLGISTCDMGNIPLMLGVREASAPLGVHMLHLVPSCSSLCLMYLPQLWLLLQLWWCLLGCHLFHQCPWLLPWWGFLQHWVAWSGSATTPDAKMLWRCYWSWLCTTAATAIFDASSGLCQLCYGFSIGRFLFQSWASHCFVYFMFGVHSGVCFLLSGAKLDAILTYGGSTY